MSWQVPEDSISADIVGRNSNIKRSRLPTKLYVRRGGIRNIVRLTKTETTKKAKRLMIKSKRVGGCIRKTSTSR